jgi:uncharacterized membrane protein YphA (DoxX/SURF4 family)
MDTSVHIREERTADLAELALKGFIIVGAFIGYEWFMSGLTKFVRGDFPSGLAAELTDKSKGTVSWYKGFLDGTVIPNGKAFGILIEFGEFVVGLTFIVAAIVLLWRWKQLSYRGQVVLFLAVAVASLGAIFMNLNFHLANGSSHPWLIPKEGFDEGVDMDSLLPLIEAVFLVVSTKMLLRLRHDRMAARAGTVPDQAQPAAAALPR